MIAVDWMFGWTSVAYSIAIIMFNGDYVLFELRVRVVGEARILKN